MGIIIISLLGSIVLSVFISDTIGCYYLKKNNEKWQQTFDDVITHIDHILKHKR